MSGKVGELVLWGILDAVNYIIEPLASNSLLFSIWLDRFVVQCEYVLVLKYF